MSKNADELKTGAPERFGLEVPTLGSPMEAKILGHEHTYPALDMVGGRPSLVGSSVTNRRLSFTCLRRTESSKLGFAGGSFTQTLADPG